VTRQGDGTAVCLQNQPAAPTVSFHAASNFPARKQQSTVDVPLPDGMGDDAFVRSGPCFSTVQTGRLSVHTRLECEVAMAAFCTLQAPGIFSHDRCSWKRCLVGIAGP